MANTANPPGLPSRDRLITAMSDALQRRGLHGTGLAELLAAADAPRGVLYHHFPGGKTELAVAALGAYVARIGQSLDRALAGSGWLDAPPDPLAALADWLERAQAHIEDDGFTNGCPLAVVALESTPADVELRRALAEAFAAVRARIAAAFEAAGRGRAEADAVAALVVAAYEGGLLQARAAGSLEPMAQATGALLTLLRAGAR